MNKKYTTDERFEVLSAKEEKTLNKTQLEEYYRRYREYVLRRKRTNTSPGIDTIAPKLINPTVKIAEKVIPLFASKDVIHEWEGTENIPEGPVIFADTHQGLLDNFIAIPETLRHAPILHGKEVNPILLGCQLNTGWIGVVKGDKINNNNAKLDMVNLLLNGISVRYFPEGTWNLSPNKLHLPMSWGIIDTAKKAGVPIVPVAHEFVYEEINGKLIVTKIYSKYGTPIYVPIEANLSEKLEELSTQFATMKFDLMYKATLNSNDSIKNVVIDELGNERVDTYFPRVNISDDEYINYLKKQYKDLDLGKLNWPKEQRNIFALENYRVIENPKGEKIKTGIVGSDKYAFTYKNEPDFNERGDILPHPELRTIVENKCGIVPKPGEKKLSKRRRPA